MLHDLISLGHFVALFPLVTRELIDVLQNVYNFYEIINVQYFLFEPTAVNSKPLVEDGGSLFH